MKALPLPELPEWTFADYVRILRLHRRLIVIVTATFCLLTSIRMAQTPNVYRTTARILIEFATPQVVQFREVIPFAGGWQQGFLQTEHQIITSPKVMERVVEDLNLAGFPPFSRAEDPAAVLGGMVKVELIRGTKLADITVESNKRDLASRIANAVAETYIQLNLERRQQATIGGAEWLKVEVAKADQNLKSAQLALQQFKERHRELPVGKEAQATVLQRLAQLNSTVTQAKEERIEAETKYRAKHPILLELQGKERELAQALAEQEQIVLEMNRLSIEYNNLQRDVDTGESIYDVLLTRLKELSVQEGVQANNVQMVYPAKIPTKPVRPNRKRAIATGTLFGLLLGCGLAFLSEALSKTIRSRQEFERVLEIPFLGHVPIVDLPKRHRGKETLLLLTQPQSNTAEALRAIRTTLEFMLPAGQSHALLLTSSVPAEGKSFMSLHLAIVLQELGRKVLLIDADMRRPSLHQLLKLPLEPGLSAYLQGQAALEELIQVTDVPLSLPLIPAGLTPPQPPDLLVHPRMREMLERFKQEYTYVLIDSPPVLAVADTAAMAGLVDGIIYVVWANRSHRDVVLAGKQRMVDVGAKIIGGILNATRLESERGYYYYYSHRYYRDPGRKHRSDRRPDPSAPPPPTPATLPPQEEVSG